MVWFVGVVIGVGVREGVGVSRVGTWLGLFTDKWRSAAAPRPRPPHTRARCGTHSHPGPGTGGGASPPSTPILLARAPRQVRVVPATTRGTMKRLAGEERAERGAGKGLLLQGI